MKATRKKKAPAADAAAVNETSATPEVAEATVEAGTGAAPDAAGAPVEASREPTPEEKLAAMTDRYLRLQADFENFRKRTIRERAQMYKRANEELIEALLPTLDHLDLALGAVPASEQENAFVVGVRMVMEQMLGALDKFGLSSFKTGGQPFDPNVHEAIAHIPSPEVPENVIIQQTRRGFMLGDHLLRAAQVVVSSGAPEAAPDEAVGVDVTESEGA